MTEKEEQVENEVPENCWWWLAFSECEGFVHGFVGDVAAWEIEKKGVESENGKGEGVGLKGVGELGVGALSLCADFITRQY